MYIYIYIPHLDGTQLLRDLEGLNHHHHDHDHDHDHDHHDDETLVSRNPVLSSLSSLQDPNHCMILQLYPPKLYTTPTKTTIFIRF